MPFRFNPLTGSLDYFNNLELPNNSGSSNGLTISGSTINLNLASETTTGALSASDYTLFKSKKEYKTVTETKNLTTQEVADKKIILSNIPSFPETTMLSLEGGTLQRYGVDYVVNSQELSWNGLELDNFLEPGDVLRIYYQTE